MIFTPSGIFIDVREVQPANASLPISVTLDGISIDVRDVQELNVP